MRDCPTWPSPTGATLLSSRQSEPMPTTSEAGSHPERRPSLAQRRDGVCSLSLAVARRAGRPATVSQCPPGGEGRPASASRDCDRGRRQPALAGGTERPRQPGVRRRIQRAALRPRGRAQTAPRRRRACRWNRGRHPESGRLDRRDRTGPPATRSADRTGRRRELTGLSHRLPVVSLYTLDPPSQPSPARRSQGLV